jgi:hypothetical protein
MNQLVSRFAQLTQWDALKTTDRFGVNKASFIGERLIVIRV